MRQIVVGMNRQLKRVSVKCFLYSNVGFSRLQSKIVFGVLQTRVTSKKIYFTAHQTGRVADSVMVKWTVVEARTRPVVMVGVCNCRSVSLSPNTMRYKKFSITYR
jgi:hypothetical protein